MLLSIIAPVYNVEDYLQEFVYSLERQNCLNYELILVDDGSTDKSGEICDRLVRSYDNISVIHKKNGGLSEARNSGLARSTGEYVFFADSDDLFNGEELNKVLSELKNDNVDLYVMPFNTLNVDGTLDIDSYAPYTKNSTLIELSNRLVVEHKQMPWAAFQSIIKKDFLLKNGLKFDKKYNGAEDLKMFSKIIKCSPTINIYPNAIINYRSNRKGSINNTKTYSSVIGQLMAYVDTISEFSSYSKIKNYLIERLIDTLIQIPMIKDKKQEGLCYNFVIKNVNLLDTKELSRKYKIIILGLKNTNQKIGLIMLAMLSGVYKIKTQASL